MFKLYYLKLRKILRNNPVAYQAYGFFQRVLHEIKLLGYSTSYIARSGNTVGGYIVPPPKLRFRVHGDLKQDTFIQGGKRVSQDIQALLSKHHKELKDCNNYLDFGCGCARVLRHLIGNTQTTHFFGTDIDPEAIAWNRRFFKNKVDWQINQVTPTLNYEDNQFDAIVSISVFTHLNEDLQNLWLEEISRVLAPGGVAILTVHGKAIWKDTEDIASNMAKGIYFLKKFTGFWRFDGLPSFYQVTFHSKDYIYENWSKYFDIVAYEEQAIGGHQCAVVLRKRP